MSKKVLIVEDEVMLSDVYTIVLTKHGFAVEVAANGQAALKKLPVFHPDVILLDIMMPVMGGVAFLQNLTPEQKSELTIIVYSNLFDTDTDKTVRHLGASDVVLKSSMTPDQLVGLISKYCAQV